MEDQEPIGGYAEDVFDDDDYGGPPLYLLTDSAITDEIAEAIDKGELPTYWP